jgi:hypothetical protein
LSSRATGGFSRRAQLQEFNYRGAAILNKRLCCFPQSFHIMVSYVYHIRVHNVIFQHPLALYSYRSDFGAFTSFTILSSYSFIGHFMFRPNWPSSGVQVVMVKDSAVHCNAWFFPPTVVL